MDGGNVRFSVKNLFNVEGWVCVVTGGGTGIGLMIAQAFANNGARVYITGRRAETLQTAAKTWGASLAHPQGKIIPITADITDKASIQNLAQEIAKHEKHVDVLVNNAGIDGSTSTVEKGDESAQALQKELWNEEVLMWESVYRTNVIGYFFTTVAFMPLLSAATTRGGGHTGSVINISSISGVTRTSQHHYAYNTSKAAAIQLTQLLAQEMRRPGVKVRVNSIAPGIFPSEMTTEGSNEQNKSSIPVDESYGEKKGIPAGRSGGEEDMAQAALLLACNQYIYGQTVIVDGGYLLAHP
ncbi:NAD(P)-binding protein [Laetiporus sulphureus 93-53]|uniref:NAD(P)-binding protein n=1 Tax=Laetiporus sulphureus 93-53 TaxID=1314785 RepID=A0A165E9E2_9APHY|nr:NAD(P)-binding protein [Laetiporus sulphureus 93-53]KZT06522.1 NAD(P)-binding protein [Laetiporus sulphureus 93-53]